MASISIGTTVACSAGMNLPSLPADPGTVATVSILVVFVGGSPVDHTVKPSTRVGVSARVNFSGDLASGRYRR